MSRLVKVLLVLLVVIVLWKLVYTSQTEIEYDPIE